MRPAHRLYTALLILLLPGLLSAQGSLLMARSKQAFPETMLTLQQSIKDHGYQVARVQRVDVGLTAAGFETDKYRIVFYGKSEEVRRLTEEHPDLVPYLPQSFSLFAQGDETMVVAMNPSSLANAYSDPELVTLLARWESDAHSILSDVREASGMGME